MSVPVSVPVSRQEQESGVAASPALASASASAPFGAVVVVEDDDDEEEEEEVEVSPPVLLADDEELEEEEDELASWRTTVPSGDEVTSAGRRARAKTAARMKMERRAILIHLRTQNISVSKPGETSFTSITSRSLSLRLLLF